jgi:hypothetical protein
MISQIKKGTPIKAVTIPMGMIVPGRIILLAIDASDRINAPTIAESGHSAR